MILASFADWLRGNVGTYVPDNQEMTIATLIAVILIAFLFAFIAGYKKIPYKVKKWTLYGFAIFQLVFELFWRIIFVTMKGTSWEYLWPMYPCNLSGILIPIICLCNWKKGKDMFYIFGFATGVLTFAMPQGIFCSTVFSFPILKSVLQHTGILLIPLFEYMAKMHKPSFETVKYSLFGMIIHVINVLLIDRAMGLNDDYIFFDSKAPVRIPGISSKAITMSLAFFAVFFMSYISDIKKGNAWFRKALGMNPKAPKESHFKLLKFKKEVK